MRTLLLLLASAVLLSACGSKNSEPSPKPTSDTAAAAPAQVQTPAPAVDSARLSAMQRDIDKLKQKVDDKGAAATAGSGKSSSERVKFDAGRSSATINGVVNAGATKEYILGARGGQNLMARLDSRNPGVILSITGPDGKKLLENGTSYGAALEANGDYKIKVQASAKGEKSNAFSLYTEIR